MENAPPDADDAERDTYQRAVRFDGDRAEHDAVQAYQRSRRELRRSRLDTDLSVFRLQLGERVDNVASLGWYVALIGRSPDAALEARLERHLAAGTPVELPAAVAKTLRERRARDGRFAPWVE